jgi:hypothetical protein
VKTEKAKPLGLPAVLPFGMIAVTHKALTIR